MEEDPIPIMSPIFINSLIESINNIPEIARGALLDSFIAQILEGIDIDAYDIVGMLEKIKIYYQNDCIWNEQVKSINSN